MLKKDITYTNLFTEDQVTETHYFHISKTDLVEMEIEEHGEVYVAKDGTEYTGMQARLQKIAESEDGRVIMDEIKDFIRRSYGIRDGNNFIKTQANWEAFAATEAFSQMFFELCTMPEATSEFINGVIPSNLQQIAAEIQERAEKVAAGRAAQETAKASAAPAQVPTPVEGQLSKGTGAVMDALSDTATEPEQSSLAQRIDAATAENPVKLTEAELVEIDSDTLKSGLATGRIKLSA